MIGGFGGKAAAETDTLRKQVEALLAENASFAALLAALSSQFAAAADQALVAAKRAADAEERLAALGAIVAGHGAAITAGAQRADALAATLARLAEDGDRQSEAVKQARGDIARIERQAALDIEEVRRSAAVIARQLLPQRKEA